jgi:hypothetical protein
VSAALAALRARYKKYPAGYDSPKNYHFSIGCLQYEQGLKLSELPLSIEVLHKRARSRVFSTPHQLRRTKRIPFSYPTWLCERGEYGSKYYPHNQTVNEEAPVAGRALFETVLLLSLHLLEGSGR